jgi:uncharacterized protein
VDAEALLRRLLDAVQDGFTVDVPRLYAPDAEVLMPFAAGGPATLHGVQAIDAHFRAAAARGLGVRVEDLLIHRMADPHLVVAEFGYVWALPRGRTVTTANIQVVEEAGGLISRSRDYHDTAAIRRALADAAE